MGSGRGGEEEVSVVFPVGLAWLVSLATRGGGLGGIVEGLLLPPRVVPESQWRGLEEANACSRIAAADSPPPNSATDFDVCTFPSGVWAGAGEA